VRGLLAGLGVVAFGLIGAAGAQAAPVTLGSPLTAPFEFAGECNFALGCEATAIGLSEPGAVTASPIAGTVVRWRAEGTTLGSEYRINVLRANPAGTYSETAVSQPAISAGEPTETFGADLPIAVGEYVAISFPVGAGLSLLESPGLTDEVFWEQPLTLGAEALPAGADTLGDESAFNADVEPSTAPPSPPTSSGGGGASGPSPVGVGTPSGAAGGAPSSSPAEPVQCVVPRLGAKRLAAARKMLIKAHCRLGKVRGRRTHTALVVSQSPHTGARLAAGAKVGVVLRTPPGSTRGGNR
jgi:hypothetical protein